MAIFQNPEGQKYLLGKLFVLTFFYLNFLYLIPNYYFKKQYITYFSSIIFCFLIVVLLPDSLIHKRPEVDHKPPAPAEFREPRSGKPEPDFDFKNDPGPMQGPRPSHFSFQLSQNLFLFLSALFLSLAIRINNRLRQTEQLRLNAELSYLKAQINPHFLFNTLNSIYSLAIIKSDLTPTAVVKLSGMMRYVISEADHQFVSLEKEINYIKDFIDLQRLRFDDSVTITFNVTGDITGWQIAPLILIAFIENAFKHGINAEESSLIKIDISIENDQLQFLVFNNKVTVDRAEESGGLGIENTKNRLHLLYPAKHNLVITDTPNSFSVSLTLNLV
ncbi:sensor histidine kinase [Solitalea longa]|nr:sensor histidine kinase [Solitalea longa]